MWQRGWSEANPSVVSPRGRGSSTREMGGRSSREEPHSSTALSGSRSRNGDGGGRAWIGSACRGRGVAAHPSPEGVSSAGLHHDWAREGEEVERGTSNWKGRFEIERITRRFK